MRKWATHWSWVLPLIGLAVLVAYDERKEFKDFEAKQKTIHWVPIQPGSSSPDDFQSKLDAIPSSTPSQRFSRHPFLETGAALSRIPFHEVLLPLLLVIALIVVSRVFTFRSPHVRWWTLWALGLACSIFSVSAFLSLYNGLTPAGIFCALIGFVIFLKGIVHLWKSER